MASQLTKYHCIFLFFFGEKIRLIHDNMESDTSCSEDMKRIGVNKYNNSLVHFDCMKMLVKCGIEVHIFFSCTSSAC